MADLTRNGVCYDLRDTPYTHEYAGYRFHFSSEYHRRNFAAKVLIREQWLSDSLTRRFKFRVDASIIAIFQLYRQIETRGFYVVSVTGREFASLDDVSIVAHMGD